VARKKIDSATDQRPFSMIYHDFLDNDILTEHEKMVFIALKRFADSKNQCFPSLGKIADISRISKRKVQDTLKELERKQIIRIENRSRKDGGATSNLYILHDFKELWNADSSKDMATAINEYEEIKLITELQARGYTVIKEKEPTSEPAKVTDVSTQSDQSHNLYNYITQKEKSQERYTVDQIKQIFNYKIMIHDNPYQKKNIDSVMDILHTTMNTTQKTIRIAGESKSSMTVISKLMKLNNESIMYAIKKYTEQTEKIKNPISYMRTLLYNAPEQFNLDIQNQIVHDMAHRDEGDKQ